MRSTYGTCELLQAMRRMPRVLGRVCALLLVSAVTFLIIFSSAPLYSGFTAPPRQASLAVEEPLGVNISTSQTVHHPITTTGRSNCAWLPLRHLAQAVGICRTASIATTTSLQASSIDAHGASTSWLSRLFGRKKPVRRRQYRPLPVPPLVPSLNPRAAQLLQALDDYDACGQEFGIPKVAMMFLTRGNLPHHRMWEQWFTFAANFIPLPPLRASHCTEEAPTRMQQLCGAHNGSSVLKVQHLFSVYVHPAPNFTGFQPSSVFYGREVTYRVQTSWGSYGLAEATRLMLRTALLNPLNQKFLLISESCIPLYPPYFVYQQLISEPFSRINACSPANTLVERRFAGGMQYHGLPPANWRKSSQWVVLTRKHAELVRDDELMHRIFATFCTGVEFDEELGRQRDCYSDEHYLPTLLSWKEVGHETDCFGNVMNSDWSVTGTTGHPRTYQPHDVTKLLILRLRQAAPDVVHQSMREALAYFVAPHTLPGSACSGVEPGPWQHPLDSGMPLFARKFPNNTVAAVAQVLLDCNQDCSVE